MKSLFLSLLVLATLLASAFAVDSEDGVLVLTEQNFDAAISANPLIVVEFYAPWCGHCKKLTPEWAKAAQSLQSAPTPVPLAKVDATVHKDLAQRFGVRGYPTIKVFRKGVARDYKGPRDAAGIASHVASLVGPAAPAVSSLDALAAYVALDSNKPLSGSSLVLGVFGGDADAASGRRMAFENLAEEWRGKLAFLQTSDTAVITSPSVGQAANFVGLVVFRSFDASPGVIAWPESNPNFARGEGRQFIARAALPLAGELDQANMELYTARGQPSVTFFMSGNANQNTQNYVTKRLYTVAQRIPSYSFAFANALKHKKLMEMFAFTDEDVERNVAVGVSAGAKKYKLNTATFSAEVLEAFVRRIIAGTEPAFIKSEEPPANNAGAGEGKVTVVTAKTFQEIVLDETKDVLLEMYAPWCGHCKKLAPIYDDLAKEYVGVSDLLIAKVDAQANDIPAPYSASGFPTIYWSPKGQKSAPVKFNGDRTVEGFKKFIAEKRPSTEAKTEL
jgi:protein disulfide isomerase